MFPQFERSPENKFDGSSILLDIVDCCLAGICDLEIQRISDSISALSKQYSYLC